MLINNYPPHLTYFCNFHNRMLNDGSVLGFCCMAAILNVYLQKKVKQKNSVKYGRY